MSGNNDLPAVGFFQSGDTAQRGGLATTRRPEQSIKAPFFDVEADIVDSLDPGIVAIFVDFYQTLDFDHNFSWFKPFNGFARLDRRAPIKHLERL